MFWCLVVPLWLRAKWRLPHGFLGAFIGLVVLLPTWLALVQLRIPGPDILLAIMAVVGVSLTVGLIAASPAEGLIKYHYGK